MYLKFQCLDKGEAVKGDGESSVFHLSKHAPLWCVYVSNDAPACLA